MQKFMNNLGPVLFFSIPLILGAAIYFFKIQQAVDWLESLNGWLLKKREAIAGKEGFISKWFFRPMLWGLSKIMQMTEQIQDPFMRSSVRIAAYLYFAGILTYISLTIVIGIAIFMIVMWLIFEVLMDDGRSSTSRPVRERVREKNLYDTKGFFNKKVGRIDENGNIYDTTGFFDKKVGNIDEEGRIKDTTAFFDKEKARIDDEGNIHDTTGFFDKKIGKIDNDGNIKDTTGFLDKNVGRLKKD